MPSYLDCEKCGQLSMPKTSNWVKRRIKEHGKHGRVMYSVCIAERQPGYIPKFGNFGGGTIIKRWE